MLRKIYVALMAALAFIAVSAKPIDEAKTLYEQGEYERAAEILRQVVHSAPKDGVANYYLGLTLMEMGSYAEAEHYLDVAQQRGVADAWLAMADIAMMRYDVHRAQACLDGCMRQLDKDKKPATAAYEASRAHLLQLRNMLERVEQVEIVDSMHVARDDFFAYYRLSPWAGYFVGYTAVPPEYADSALMPAFMPQTMTEVLWAGKDGEGRAGLYSVSIYDDGTFGAPEEMGPDVLGQGGDAAYPYLCSDGATFYFASNGEGSLGGYDIFVSRRDGDGSVLKPQNIGMPYNSPYDDYMMVIDEDAGLGWWATDRNQLQDSLTIYVFKPSQNRVNVSPSAKNLLSLAKAQGFERRQDAILSNPALKPGAEPVQEQAQFYIPMPNGQIYTNVSQFRKPQARSAISQYVDRKADLESMEIELAELRQSYGAGETTLGEDILRLEQRIEASRRYMAGLLKEAVVVESSRR